MWTPDIFLQEDVSDDISTGPTKYKTPIVLHYDGTCTWLIPVKVQSTCSIDVRYFPFDRQVCKFVFGSWTHDQKGENQNMNKCKTLEGDIYESHLFVWISGTFL